MKTIFGTIKSNALFFSFIKEYLKTNVMITKIEHLITNKQYIISHKTNLLDTSTFLKMHSLIKAINPIDIVVIDNIKGNNRFNIIYVIQSVSINNRFIISTYTNEISPIISIQNLFSAFNWAEREIWDMFGIFIIKHPDLRKILTDYGFIGHPLQKNFPLSGFKEVQYDDKSKSINLVNIELSQSIRNVAVIGNTWL